MTSHGKMHALFARWISNAWYLLGPDKINWIIIGGESGPGARQLHINWVDDLISQGRKAGVSIFLKQLGKQYKIGEGLYVEDKDPKGGDITEWAPMYQIREIPK